MSPKVSRDHQGHVKQQRGIALLLVLSLLGLLAVVLVIGFTGDLTRQNKRQQQTADALARAKDALIGYAANYRDDHPDQVFGYLPCPDMDGIAGEGIAKTACGATDVTVIGRLPTTHRPAS